MPSGETIFTEVAFKLGHWSKVSVDAIEATPRTSEERHCAVADSELLGSKAHFSLNFVPQHLARAWFSKYVISGKTGFH